MKVAVIAKSIDPSRGSEFQHSYQILKNLLERCIDIHFILICPPFDGNIAKLKKELSAFENLRIITVPFQTYGHLLHLPIIRRVIYRLWHLRVRKVIKNNEYDVIHILNTMNYDLHGYYFKHPKVIWGPIGGAEVIKNFDISDNKLFYDYLLRLKNYLNTVNYKYNFVFKKAKDSYNHIICATKEMYNLLNKTSKSYLPETGVIGEIEINGSLEYKRIIWAGSLIPRKNPLFIKNFVPLLQEIGFSLDIFGDGKLREEVSKLASNYQFINYHGFVDRSKLLSEFKKSSYCLITSIRDANTNIAFEAIENGVPVITVDNIGISEIIKTMNLGCIIEGKNVRNLNINSLKKYKFYQKNILENEYKLSYKYKSDKIANLLREI